MGEQPIFSTKAHVFHIDPKTKTSWIPASNQAVVVSFFYDSTRSLYRIISVEGTKAVINSTITPSMLFTKTSQKFGQWSDVRANTVYGLGFDSEDALVNFIEQFKEVKKATRLVAQKGQANGNVCQISTSTVLQSASLNHDECIENSTPNDQSSHQRSHSLTSLQTPVQSPRSTPKTKKSPTLSLSSTTSLQSNSTEAQLRYENDKLKIALAQSSANAKKWEIELQTLKSNNSRLTIALQESTANVEEWKKQLEAYKEECTHFKKNMLEFKAVQGGSSDLLSSQKQMLEQEENKRKDQKIQQLTQKIADLNIIENGNQEIYKRFQDAQTENKTLIQKIANLQEQLKNTFWENQENKKCIQELQSLLGVKLKEAGAIHDQIMSKMQS